jgi:hypothetical protein
VAPTEYKQRYFKQLEGVRVIQAISGSINRSIKGSAQVLSLADENTKIIPGRGAISNRKDLQAFHDMPVAIRNRVAAMMKDGKSLEAIQAAKPSADLDARFDGGFITAEPFVESVYRSLSAHCTAG